MPTGSLFDYVKLLLDFAASLAWPIGVVVLVWLFHKPLRDILHKLPGVLDRLQSIKIKDVEAVLSQQSSAALTHKLDDTVPAEQLDAAFKIKAVDLGQSEIRLQALKLAQEYETTRSLLNSGPDRTRRMNQVMAKMRAIALAAAPLLDEFAVSKKSPGERLVAIAILQLKPNVSYLDWLADRMKTETPFVFFHAGVALLSAAKFCREGGHAEATGKLKDAINRALKTLMDFKGGTPDQNTLDTLNQALAVLQV